MMDKPMGPEAAPEAPAQEQPQDQGGTAGKVIMGIQKMLGMLMQAMQKAPSVTDQDRQALGAVMEQFQSFVDGLGQGEAPAQGVGAPEAGAREVKPAM